MSNYSYLSYFFELYSIPWELHFIFNTFHLCTKFLDYTKNSYNYHLFPETRNHFFFHCHAMMFWQFRFQVSCHSLVLINEELLHQGSSIFVLRSALYINGFMKDVQNRLTWPFVSNPPLKTAWRIIINQTYTFYVMKT